MFKRRLKLAVQMLAAFLIALFAFNVFYEPHQDTVRAAVKQQLQSQSASESAAPAAVEGKLKITLLDVGHGDAILLQDGKRNIMVDVGAYNKDKKGFGGKEVLVRSLTKAGIVQNRDRLNTVIISHHHGDHLGNIKWLAGAYKISNIYDNAYVHPTNGISQWLNSELRAGHYHNRVLRAGDRIDIDKNYYFEVLAPGDFIPQQDYQNINNTSVVMKLHYGNFSMLFTGDAEAPVEDLLQQKYGSQLRSDILKVGHHGSKTSSYYKFINNVRPKYALISCGAFEIYHHPNKNVVGSLQHLGAKVLTTFDHGNITVTTDGEKFDVATEK